MFPSNTECRTRGGAPLFLSATTRHTSVLEEVPLIHDFPSKPAVNFTLVPLNSRQDSSLYQAPTRLIYSKCKQRVGVASYRHGLSKRKQLEAGTLALIHSAHTGYGGWSYDLSVYCA